MRAPILGVMFGDCEELLMQFLQVSTAMTHRDPKALTAAIMVARSARLAVIGTSAKPSEVLDQLMRGLPDSTSDWKVAIDRIKESLNSGESTREYAAKLYGNRGVSGYVLHTVPAVLHAWLRYPGDYRSAVTELIASGGDTDTTAAIAGGIIGAGTGVDGIPAEWWQRIGEWPRDVRWMTKLAQQSARMATGADLGRPLRANPLGVLARKMVFAGAVAGHVLRRLLPPY